MDYEYAQEKDIKELYDLQLRAFESEAEMINSRNVPALMESYEGNRGIAIGLLTAVEELTQAQAFELYTCTKSYININLYEKLGYRIYKVEQGYSDLSFAYMRKTLDH